MTTEYKLGDRIRVVIPSDYGRTGTVTVLSHHREFPVSIELDDDRGTSIPVQRDEIEPLEAEPKERT